MENGRLLDWRDVYLKKKRYRTICEDFSICNSMEDFETYEKEVRLFDNDCQQTDQRKSPLRAPRPAEWVEKS